MNRHDMRMRESGGHARFAQEALARVATAHAGRQRLDGDIAVELHVAREIHDAHAATAKLALQRVFAGERGLQVEEFAGGRCHVHAV